MSIAVLLLGLVDQCNDLLCTVALANPVGDIGLAEDACQRGQNLQMLFGRILRNEQGEDQVDRLLIGRIIVNRLVEFYKAMLSMSV